MPIFWFKVQDLAVLILLMAGLLIVRHWQAPWLLPAVELRTWQLCLAGGLLVLLLWWGCYAFMGNYPLSRDEHMVIFDMAVFAKGHLAEPVAAQWRSFAYQLVPAFLLNSDNPSGFVSGYLPVNAMLRLGFSYIADPALMNPLLACIGGLALFDIARKLFGEDHRAILVTLILYVLNAQMLVNAMTAYSMTGHMALNLVWLAAFLRGRFWGHAIAITVGFLAVGLHQLVFHPLFAAPFLLWRLCQGHWRLVLVYALAYAAIGLFWIAYPLMASLQTGVSTVGGGKEDDFFRDRVWPLIVNREPMTLPYMALNLLRFVAWQHLALLPLLCAAIPLARRWQSIVAPMLGGLVLAILLFTIVLPFQGHGWGYRYLHPYLGSFALLGGFGYQALAKRGEDNPDGMIWVMTLLTLIALPWLVARTYDFVAPQVAFEQLLKRQKARFALIDSDDITSKDHVWAANAIDHVRNLPDLTNRPLRFSSRYMSREQLTALCAQDKVVVVRRSDMHRVGMGLNLGEQSPRFEKLIDLVRRDYPSCFRQTLP